MSFPQRRVELYEEAQDALLKKWDSSRNIKRDEIYRKLSLGRKRQMLARIAAENFEQGEYFFQQADLTKRITRYLQKLPPADFDEDIDGESVLKAIEAQHGLLVERAHKIYSFSHLSFQEYFTAKYIVEDASEATLARVIEQHLTNDRWGEVFLLIASLLPEADTFFTLMRGAINNLIKGDEKLVKLVRWANRKAAKDYAMLGPQGCEAALTLARTLDLALTVSGHLDFTFNHTRIPGPTHISDFALDLYLASTLAYTRAFTQTTLLPLGLFDDLDLARKQAAKLNFSELRQALLDLTIPTVDSVSGEWETFAQNLQAITIHYREIGHDWCLTQKQHGRIEQYLLANRLLLDCLQLAYVSDRARIENSLWLPPGERRET
jgi:predicted NACHT family NTPase